MTTVPTDGAEVVTLMTEPEARRATERIRLALDRVSTAWADLGDRITDAYRRRADLALGYHSWQEYAEAELRPSEGLAAEVRRQLVGMLSQVGMSTRSIAPTVGVSNYTVSKDRQVLGDLTPEPEPTEPERLDPNTEEVEPLDTYHRPASVADPAPRITGLDGKSYPRPEPKTETPRRPPLRDGFRDAALDLAAVCRRLERLAADERLPRNRSEVARYANDLTLAIDALQRITDQLKLPN